MCIYEYVGAERCMGVGVRDRYENTDNYACACFNNNNRELIERFRNLKALYNCARLRYWQNLMKSMGRSLQVQTVNYLSIQSLESSMDAQNN